MKKQEKAFKWIVDVLNKHQVEFVVSGGLAARVYGSERPLVDIDFDVEKGTFEKIINDVKAYVTSGPMRHKGQAFENTLLELNYNGINIDLADVTETKIFDANKNSYIPDFTDLSRFESREVFGVRVPVMIREDLIAYKRKLSRVEDLIDIEALKNDICKKPLLF